MNTDNIASLFDICSTQTLHVLLALAAVLLASKVWTASWNGYYRMRVTSSESTISQKLEFLGEPTIRIRFTIGSEVGAVLYDHRLGRALVALHEAHTMTQLKDWKSAYMALREAQSQVSQYKLGHLPPRDMPQPRAAE